MIKGKGIIRGFTLLELMALLAVVGVLVAIAIANYRPYVLKSKRKEAIADILALQQILGRQFSINHGVFRLPVNDENVKDFTDKRVIGSCAVAGDYTSGSDPVAYRLTVSLTKKRQAYTITAEPCSSQADDRCGNLQIDHTGLRSVKEKGAATFTINRDCF